MVRTRWSRLTDVSRLVLPWRCQGASVIRLASPRPSRGVRALGRVLCLALLTLRWTGTEAVVPPVGSQLRVTTERGLLTVAAKAVALQQVCEAISSESGSRIILVNAPADPLPVTVTIERQPLAQVIPRLLKALRTTGEFSYVVVHPPHARPWVKIFFPPMAQSSEPEGETGPTYHQGAQALVSQELQPPAAGESSPSTLTQEALEEVRERLEAHGAVTAGLDDMQLLALAHRLEQGLPVQEGEPPPPLPAAAEESRPSGLTLEALEEVREELEAHGAVTEGLDDVQLLTLAHQLEQGLPVQAGEQPPD